MVKHALLNQYNVILMGGAVLFSAAVASPPLLFAAAVGELLWLVVSAPNPAFRRWVDRQAQSRDEEPWLAGLNQLAATVEGERRAGAQSTGTAIVHLSRMARQLGIGEGLRELNDKVGALLQAFAHLAEVEFRLARQVAQGQPAALEEEILRLGHEAAAERDALARIALRQAMNLAQRRLNQLEHLEGARRVLHGKLGAVETTVAHVTNELASGQGIERVMAALEDTLATARFNPELEATLLEVPSRPTKSMPRLDPTPLR